MKVIISIVTSSIFWNAVAAFATVSAVVVSLYLANRKEKANRKLEVGNTVSYLYEEGKVLLTVTLDNIGNRPIIIMDCGIVSGNDLETTYNKYLKKAFNPQIIEIGSSTILEYEYNFGRRFNDNEIENDNVRIAFCQKRFGVRDSRNIMHN